MSPISRFLPTRNRPVVDDAVPVVVGEPVGPDTEKDVKDGGSISSAEEAATAKDPTLNPGGLSFEEGAICVLSRDHFEG